MLEIEGTKKYTVGARSDRRTLFERPAIEQKGEAARLDQRAFPVRHRTSQPSVKPSLMLNRPPIDGGHLDRAPKAYRCTGTVLNLYLWTIGLA